MGHGIRPAQKGPVPKATVVYVPESQVLYFENGQIREAAEEMARLVLVYFGKEDESQAVAVRIDSAEVVLKPLVDAILAKNGITPEPSAAEQLRKKGNRETVTTLIQGKELELAPYAEAIYEPAQQTLHIENGDASKVSKEMAKDIHVLYDKEVDDSPASPVAIRIERAEVVLRPFVDAVLAKYGIEPEKGAQVIDAKAAEH